MLAPRRRRERFEDDGPSGAALLHDALSRLARHFGESPPLSLWVRTAPRDAERFCWRIDIVPRLAPAPASSSAPACTATTSRPSGGRRSCAPSRPGDGTAAMPALALAIAASVAVGVWA